MFHFCETFFFPSRKFFPSIIADIKYLHYAVMEQVFTLCTTKNNSNNCPKCFFRTKTWECRLFTKNFKYCQSLLKFCYIISHSLLTSSVMQLHGLTREYLRKNSKNMYQNHRLKNQKCISNFSKTSNTGKSD